MTNRYSLTITACLLLVALSACPPPGGPTGNQEDGQELPAVDLSEGPAFPLEQHLESEEIAAGAMTFEQLYNTHFPDIYRFAVWLTNDPTQAEDVASETFIRAWARRDRFRTETLKGYLLTIARNVFLNHRQQSANHEEIPDELPDEAPDPQRTAVARMDLDRVTRVLAEFPQSDRLALLLRSEQSLPYEEIARVLGISAGAARVRVHRARRRLLAEAMTDNGGE